MKTWRDIASPVIEAVIKANKELPAKELKNKISEAYPFGERQYHPYKVWLDEVKIQLGEKHRKKPGRQPILINQKERLFND